MSDSRNECTSSREPLAWIDVWDKELDQVDLRREMVSREDDDGAGFTSSSTESGSSDSSGPPDDLDDVTKRALSMNLVGLAFSGGGIRSATFNLGILQGLAEQKLLKHVDYLSTVSGGGFIGSWFTALIRRTKGVKEAESLLQPIRRQQSFSVEHQGDWQGSEKEVEPEPIAHLRAYSNYLAPKVGLLSQDSLSLVSAYVRNLVASLLVLLPALIACIALIRLAHAMFLGSTLAQFACAPELAAMLTVLILTVSLLMMGVAVGRIREIRRHQEKEQVPIAHQVHLSPFLYTIIVMLLVAAAVTATWLLSSPEHVTNVWGQNLASLKGRPGTVTAFFAALAAVCYVLQELWQGLERFRFWTLVARSIGGAAGGILVYFVVNWLFWRDAGTASQSFDFVVGIPLTLMSWVLASKIALALSGEGIKEEEQEWWGRMAATTARAALLWFVVTLVGIFGPVIVEHSAYWIRATVTVGWLASTIGGLIAGRSSNAQAGSNPIRRLVLSAVPYVFLVGLICGLALAVSAMVDLPPHEWASDNETTFLERLTDYEVRLEQTRLWSLWIVFAASVAICLYASKRIDVNSTSLNNLYANRLTRCYLGASRPKERGSEAFGRAVSKEKPRRQPHPWTDFDPLDDLKLSELTIREGRGQKGFDGPFQLFNTAINLAGGKNLAHQDRKANSFTLTPLACGNP